jgi:hypothetical protein
MFGGREDIRENHRKKVKIKDTYTFYKLSLADFKLLKFIFYYSLFPWRLSFLEVDFHPFEN